MSTTCCSVQTWARVCVQLSAAWSRELASRRSWCAATLARCATTTAAAAAANIDTAAAAALLVLSYVTDCAYLQLHCGCATTSCTAVVLLWYISCYTVRNPPQASAVSLHARHSATAAPTCQWCSTTAKSSAVSAELLKCCVPIPMLLLLLCAVCTHRW